MPVTIKRLPDQPIIIASYSGHITVGDVLSVFTRSAEIVKPSDNTIYRISHIENTEAEFADILHFAQTSASDVPGSSTDSRFHPVIVGHDKWIKLFVQFMSKKQFGGVVVPCFLTLSQALEYVQSDIAKS